MGINPKAIPMQQDTYQTQLKGKYKLKDKSKYKEEYKLEVMKIWHFDFYFGFSTDREFHRWTSLSKVKQMLLLDHAVSW